MGTFCAGFNLTGRPSAVPVTIPDCDNMIFIKKKRVEIVLSTLQDEAFSASTEYWVKKSTLSRTDRLYTRNNSIPTYLLSILFFPDKTEESLELVSLA